MFENVKTRKFISLFLSILILVTSLCSCNSKSDLMEPFKDNGVENGIESANTKYFPGYCHYNPDEFYKKCDELVRLVSQSNNMDEAWKLYDELYEDAILVYEYKFTAKMGLDENVNNNYFKDEVTYISSLSIDMFDKIKTICHEIANSDNAESFQKHLDNDLLFDLYKGYSPISNRLKELQIEENELEAQYLNIATEINETIENGVLTQKEANEKLGDIFLKLISVRKKIAKEAGYKNYPEYADKEMYFRDYTDEDLSNLKESIKKFGKDLDYYIYYAFPDIEMAGVDTDILVCDVGEIVSKFSKKADEAYTFLTNNGLISAGYETTRSDSEYTIDFPNESSAIILLKQYSNGQFYNYRTCAHELGHFTHFINMSNPISLFYENGCLDILELHSNFLETLFSIKCDDLFTEPEYCRGFELASLSNSILSGCYYDDWQRAIYESERDLSLDEINELFKHILLEYGIEEYSDMEYGWIWVVHNFTAPMYYISYAVSAFASLELWNLAQYDFDFAVSVWEKSLLENPYTEGYMEAINNIGLIPFTNSEQNEVLFSSIMNYMQYVDELTYADYYEDLDEGQILENEEEFKIEEDIVSTTNLE